MGTFMPSRSGSGASTGRASTCCPASSPNAAHPAVAELQRRGIVRAVDHPEHRPPARAGGQRGRDRGARLDQTAASACGAAAGRRCEELVARADAAEDGVPRCDCGFPMKSGVVLFGEALPAAAIEPPSRHARRRRRDARDRLLAAGGAGQPAAGVVLRQRRDGWRSSPRARRRGTSGRRCGSTGGPACRWPRSSPRSTGGPEAVRIDLTGRTALVIGSTGGSARRSPRPARRGRRGRINGADPARTACRRGALGGPAALGDVGTGRAAPRSLRPSGRHVLANNAGIVVRSRRARTRLDAPASGERDVRRTARLALLPRILVRGWGTARRSSSQLSPRSDPDRRRSCMTKTAQLAVAGAGFAEAFLAAA